MAFGLTVIKRFTYRGQNEEWSNDYWFDGTTPADAAAWRTFFDAFVADEAALIPATGSIIAGYGYDSTTPGAHAVWSVDLTVSPNTPVVGTFSASYVAAPGDSAGWIRWKTSRTNSKGKPIYLRKYYHPAIIGTAPDTISPAWGTAADAFATNLKNGHTYGGVAVTIRSQSHSETVVAIGHSTYATTRTLKRRGKRPH